MTVETSEEDRDGRLKVLTVEEMDDAQRAAAERMLASKTGCPSPVYLSHDDMISVVCGEGFDDTEAIL